MSSLCLSDLRDFWMGGEETEECRGKRKRKREAVKKKRNNPLQESE